MRAPRPTRLLSIGWGVFLLLVQAPVPGDAQSFESHGRVSVQAVTTEGAQSWLEGGFGVLPTGTGEEQRVDDFLGRLETAVTWSPGHRFAGHLHVQATSSRSSRDAAAGVIEGYVEARWRPGTLQTVRGRAGVFFLPTSFENVAPLWRSPYTISPSALNTWIGEEVRPTGLQIDYRKELASGSAFYGGVCGFGGNDSAGTLLAWRGWSVHDQVGLWDEVLPLPPLPSLADGGVFGVQRDDGTKSFGRDLDDRWGWAAWLGATGRNGPSLQATLYDNRGDRGLHHGEYAWETEFVLVGGELPLGRRGLLAGEWMSGRTGMQPGSRPRVQLDFDSWYVLASWQIGRWTASGRWEGFETVDRARYPGAESTDQDGKGWTVALGWASDHWRSRLEAVDLDSERPGPVTVGAPSETGGRQVRFEIAFSW